MNKSQQEECQKLRGFGSAEAAEWLVGKYGIEQPHWGEAFVLMPHRSWSREDQVLLARHYFQKLPFAQGRPYQVFASLMSLPVLIRVLREFMPHSAQDVGLLLYYLAPVLRQAARSAAEVHEVEEFLSVLAARAQQGAEPDAEERNASSCSGSGAG